MAASLRHTSALIFSSSSRAQLGGAVVRLGYTKARAGLVDQVDRLVGEETIRI